MQKFRLKRTAAFLMCLAMVFSMAMPTFAAGNPKAVESKIPVDLTTYSRNGYTFEKLSHAAQPTETFDGVADYLGNHVIAEYKPGESAEGKGDSVQSYSYCAASSGDWVYIGTMYGALSAYNQAKAALTGMGMDGDMAVAIVDAMFNGKLNKGKEADDYYAGSIFFKFNVVTGETKLLMSREMYEKGECTGVPIFRSAVEYNGKLYFVGLISNGEALKDVFKDMYYKQFLGQGMNEQMAQAYANAAAKQHALNMEIMMQSGIPSIYELDPATDELKKVYECVGLKDYLKLNGDVSKFLQNTMDRHAVFTSTRAISTFKDYLIAGGIQVDTRYPNGRPDGYAPGDACVMATNDPGSGDFKVIANMEDLFDYPAIWRDGSSGGGGIYQTVEYNGRLYVAIVSGTYETRNEATGQFRPFAVVRGDYDPTMGAVDDRNAWTWTPVIGDTEDNARYTFGIDPARTASGSCTLQVYDGYLYIGEYNDVNGSLTGILQRKQFNTLRHNLEQSINLYRMDADENIELVVGDATEMFPNGSVSGWGSGYETHMTQYTWMTTVFDDTMYLSTMDETSLLHTFSQVVNGELLTMSKEEWESQINYLKVLVDLMKPKMEETAESIKENIVEEVHEAVGIMPLTEEETEEATEAPVEETEEIAEEPIEEPVPVKEEVKTVEDAQAVVEAVVDSLSDVEELTEEQIESAVEAYLSGSLENVNILAVEETESLTENLNTMSEQLDSDDIASFYAEYSETLDAFEQVKSMLPEEVVKALEMLLSIATRDNIEDFLVCMKYMTGSTAGFDLYAIKTNGDGVDITTVTTNGFNDRYNHGLRIFAATDDYMTIGTANPFNGTQLWRMAKSPEKEYSHIVHHFDTLVDHKDPAVGVKGYDVFVCTECDETDTKVIKPLPNPAPTPKPDSKTESVARPAAVTGVKPVSPKTGDNGMAILLLAAAGMAALAGAHSLKRREE